MDTNLTQTYPVKTAQGSGQKVQRVTQTERQYNGELSAHKLTH